MNQFKTISVTMALLASACSAVFAQSDGAKTQDKAAAEIREQDRAALMAEVSKSRLDELLSRANATRDKLAAFKEQVGKFNTRLDALQTNEEGKKIGLDRTSVQSFMDLQRNPVASADEVDQKVRALDAIIKAITGMETDVKAGVLPPESVTDEVEGNRQWLILAQVRLEASQEWIQAAIDKAPKDVDLSKTQTLKQRIGAALLAETQALDGNLVAGADAARPAAEKIMFDAGYANELLEAQAKADGLARQKEAEIKRMQIEFEMKIAAMEEEQKKRLDALNKQLADSQAARMAQDAQNHVTLDKATQDAELTIKRQKCHDPEVTRILSPFLSNGYVQPISGRGIDSIPMSLKELGKFGALAPGKNGLEKLMQCANSARWNDRPHWGAFVVIQLGGGNYRATNDDIEMAKKARDYLNELGEAMVAEKMLSP